MRLGTEEGAAGSRAWAVRTAEHVRVVAELVRRSRAEIQSIVHGTDTLDQEKTSRHTGGNVGKEATHGVKLAVHPQSELSSLRKWLTLTPGVEVHQEAGTPGSGEQGAFDTLSVVAGSTGLVAAIRVLPQYLRAKRSDVAVTVEVRGKKLTVDAKNVEEIMPILERLLDD
ncbi:hypothetical protein OG912_20650 [Streptomyces sp. NBC_00464]|uniref:effector-associated constant component EACC1 n=1 Tax=Streptomyces sp. NBC_00464 TaxID=2975751 RepID=UPI002E17D847